MQKKFFLNEICSLVFQNRWQHLVAFVLMGLSSGAVITQSIITKGIIDEAIGKYSISKLIVFISIDLVAITCQLICQYYSGKLYIEMGNTIVFKLRQRLIEKIDRMPGGFFCDEQAGNLINIIYEDTALIKNLVTVSLFVVISDIIMGIPLLIYIFVIKKEILLVVLFVQPILHIIQKKYDILIYEKAKVTREISSKYSAVLQETLSNYLSILLINGNGYSKKRIEIMGQQLKKESIDLELYGQRRKLALSFVSILSSVIILGVGGYSVIKGGMTFGGLIVFMQYSGKVFSPILSVANYLSEYKKVLPSVARIWKILDLKNCVNSGKNQINKRQFDVEFRNVSFSYEEKKVLDKMNFRLRKGEFVSIVGESASGKSTIISLLLRLWEISEGQILINGCDISEYDIYSLKNSIGVVSQNPVLFNDTIRENITFGNDNISDKEIMNILEIVNLADYVKELPQGLDTQIGDNGINLSGGQKQRIVIARVLLRKPCLFVFDESTSALDKITEKNVLSNILKNYPNISVLFVTHRLEMIKNSHQIIVIREGEVVEKGTHNKLMASKGEYYRLYTAYDGKVKV